MLERDLYFGPLVENPDDMVKLFVRSRRSFLPFGGADNHLCFKLGKHFLLSGNYAARRASGGESGGVPHGCQRLGSIVKRSQCLRGQVEAQLLIRPYVATMTMSELLASMTGSMACVAGECSLSTLV